jgi:hypothetical protein
MTDEKAKQVLSRLDELKAARNTIDSEFQKIVDYVRPEGADFSTRDEKGRAQINRSDKIYDSTARDSVVTFAGGIESNLTNPVERWFSVRIEGVDDEQLDHEALLWLDNVTDIVYSQFNRPEGGFYTAVGEAYTDLGSYGTDVIGSEWDGNGVVYRSYPLGNCWLDEGADQLVDTNFREIEMTKRQIEQRFGRYGMVPDSIMREKDSTRRFVVVHAVYPRSDAAGSRAINKRYASCWVCADTKSVLHESGYDSFPYAVSRWAKRAGQVYGFSPARICLPDILMVNRFQQQILKRAMKVTSPPLLVPNSGYVLPINTSPDGVTFHDAFSGQNEVRELYQNVRQDLGISLEMLTDVRNSIRKCFHVDLFELGKNNIEMKATEVIERRNEKLRQLAPMIGRQTKEKLDPIVSRTYELLNAHDRIPDAPSALQGTRLRVRYQSPAAAAQFSVRADSMRGYTEDLVALAQAYPDILDKIDPDALSAELARARQVPTAILRPSEEVEEIRAQKQQSQQMQEMAQAAQPAASAIKDIAQAQAISQ